MRTVPSRTAPNPIDRRHIAGSNDEWAAQCERYMTLETMACLSDDPIVKLPIVAA
jgi:hypothetical protein